MNSLDDYLSLAEELFTLKTDEACIFSIIHSLPQINETQLTSLAGLAEKTALTSPGLGWTIAHIARIATKEQTKDLWLQSLAAWYEGVAANRWVRPQLANSALRQARQGFLELSRLDWAAACDWQLNDLQVTNGNQIQIEKTLQNALETLTAASLDNYSAHCRLALATVQTRRYKNEEAYENIQKSSAYFSREKDEIGLAQCWLLEAALLRNNHQNIASLAKIDQATEVCLSHHQNQLLAKCYLQYGNYYLYRTTDMDRAADFYQKADSLFLQNDIEIYHAICLTWIGITCIQAGKFEPIERSFTEAARIYRKHHLQSLLADNYNSNGLFCLSKGDLYRSIHYFKKAQKLHQKLGYRTNTAVDLMNLGKAYRICGRYQDSLLTLEAGRELFLEINNGGLIADCEAEMAFTWLSLKYYDRALQHLQIAQEFYLKSNLNASLTTMVNLKAFIFFEKKEYESTLGCLQESLDRSKNYALRQQAALAHRQIGEVLVHIKDYVNAETHLNESKKEYSEMGMLLEQAACVLSLGNCASGQLKFVDAANYYREAIALSGGAFYEIEWKAEKGLAQIGEIENQPLIALTYYRKAIRSLSKIRENFWQPALAGSYTSAPTELFTDALALAVTLNSPLDVINFIEADKATSLIQQFNNSAHPQNGKRSSELEALKHEITWLQEKLNNSGNGQNNLQTILQTRHFRQQLIEKTEQYDHLQAVQERRLSSRGKTQSKQLIDIESIYRIFKPVLGENWVALDYYLQDNKLFAAAVSPGDNISYSSTLSPRAMVALESIKQSQQNGHPPEESDLRILGTSLFSAELMKTLQPETCLIISPHGLLHGIPWNALQPDAAGDFLVEKCIPVIVPSLRSAALIWGQNKSNIILPRQKGIIVGISDFKGTHPALPFVRNEVESLRPLLSSGGKILLEKDATWENLAAFSRSNSMKALSDFSFLHIASHFFADSISGRLCGLSLYEEDIFLDQLNELAPLPEMVTLSGCSSTYIRTYPGDEPVGLPTTCLLAGAKSVIGSNWPVRDEFASQFMAAFYQNYFSGLSPASALASTQRAFIAQKNAIICWAGYSCIGKY
jgi:CHAT domain-containing protein